MAEGRGMDTVIAVRVTVAILVSAGSLYYAYTLTTQLTATVIAIAICLGNRYGFTEDIREKH
jgi:hypothetical protein